MTTTTKPKKPMQRDEHGRPRLVAPLDGPTYSAMTPKQPVLIAVPDVKNHFREGYVWVGDDASGHCFGHIPADRFLALADAIRRG